MGRLVKLGHTTCLNQWIIMGRFQPRSQGLSLPAERETLGTRLGRFIHVSHLITLCDRAMHLIFVHSIGLNEGHKICLKH